FLFKNKYSSAPISPSFPQIQQNPNFIDSPATHHFPRSIGPISLPLHVWRLTMESSSSVITPEDVMGTLMNDGTIDSMRLKIITQLKANEELKNTTIKMVEQSRVLYTSGAEKQTKRELFDALRQELETWRCSLLLHTLRRMQLC
ncbi:hypothetical protein AABB24_004166, partial [Solanum stoloniferum]